MFGAGIAVGVDARHICLLVSPGAGRGRGATVGADVAGRLTARGHRVTVVDQPDPRSATDRTRHLLATPGEAPDAVVVVGGDGGVHVALNALLPGTAADPTHEGPPVHDVPPLGVVAAGSGNDFARTLGLPRDVGQGVDLIDECLRSGASFPVDLVSATGGPDGEPWGPRWFAGVLSAGFDSVVSDRANRLTWAPGPTRYALAVGRELPRYRARRYRLQLDGEAWDSEALLVSVANTVSYGGGMRIAPDASVSDGVLDVVLVRPLPRLRFLRLFPKVYAGTHTDVSEVEIRHAKRVRIHVVDGGPITGYADGERLGPLPAEIEVHSAAVAALGRAPEGAP